VCVAHRHAHVALANFSVRVFAMKTRPWPVIVVSCLLMAAGGVGLIYHLSEFKGLQPFPYELLLISVVRLVAIIFAVYMLLGEKLGALDGYGVDCIPRRSKRVSLFRRVRDALLDPRSVCVCSVSGRSFQVFCGAGAAHKWLGAVDQNLSSESSSSLLFLCTLVI
jgi:hypothetical protein